MKKANALIMAMALMIAVMAISANASDRLVLGEMFTNTS
jgi:hypothetical protein